MAAVFTPPVLTFDRYDPTNTTIPKPDGGLLNSGDAFGIIGERTNLIRLAFILTKISSGCLVLNSCPSNSRGIPSQAAPSVVGKCGDELAKEKGREAREAEEPFVGNSVAGGPIEGKPLIILVEDRKVLFNLCGNP